MVFRRFFFFSAMPIVSIFRLFSNLMALLISPKFPMILKVDTNGELSLEHNSMKISIRFCAVILWIYPKMRHDFSVEELHENKSRFQQNRPRKIREITIILIRMAVDKEDELDRILHVEDISKQLLIREVFRHIDHSKNRV